jgi:hypothetical protein
MAAQLESDVPALSDEAIVIRMQEMISAIGDSHTSFATFPPKSFNRYPITLSWFGSELRVTRTIDPYRSILGARLIRIADMDISEVMSRVNRLVPHENDYWQRAIAPGCVPYPGVMQVLGILPDPESGQWTFATDDGRTATVGLKSVSAGTAIEWISTLKEAPLYRQRPSELLWSTFLSNSATLYVNFRGYPDSGEFKRRAEGVLNDMDHFRPRRVVIDVRSNTGGDFHKVRTLLLPGLIQRHQNLRDLCFYVITGKATQSAAMVNAIDFRSQLAAVLVGEPTGGRPNGYSEAGRFRLPNSHLEVSCSTQYYHFQKEDADAVMPDHMVETSWAAYRQGHDEPMEWITSQPGCRP